MTEHVGRVGNTIRVCSRDFAICISKHMRGSSKFCLRGSNSCGFFYEGKDDPNSTKSGPLLARQRNAI